MQVLVRPELPTAAVRSSQATLAAVDISAPLATRPQSTYGSGKVVETNGAASQRLVPGTAAQSGWSILRPVRGHRLRVNPSQRRLGD